MSDVYVTDLWGEGQDQPAGITTRHWEDQTNRETCANQSCGTKFGLFNRYHHCRRCGDVFCDKCLNYQRRLSLLAHPDPNGKLYKVCKDCFDKGPQNLGQTRDLLSLYKLFRGHVQGSEGSEVKTNRVNISNFREKVSVEAECTRLHQGFEQSVHSSGIKRLTSGLMMKVPDWKRGPYHAYGDLAKSCMMCAAPFSLTRPKRFCAVCGSATCRGGDNNCSTTDLLVYVEDGCAEILPLKVFTAVVGIVGCPSKEPEVSEYLSVCRYCRRTLEDRQVAHYHHQRALLETSVNEDDFWSQLDGVDKKLKQTILKVEEQLPKYQELVLSLETVPRSNSPHSAKPADNKSNIQVLAKAQSDLGDHLTTVAMTIQSLRTLKPQSQGQATVIRNLIKSKCDYYHENMFLYRDLKRKLEIVTPLEVLTFVQAIVDKNAINSCYLAIRQLALEALHLCTKHQLDPELVVQLAEVEDVVEKELQACLRSAEEPWEEHTRCVNELIQQQLANPDRRIVRLSSRRAQKYGKKYTEKALTERCVHTLKKVYIQLRTKCTDKSFTCTKDKVKVVAEGMLAPEDRDDWTLI